MNAKRTDAEMRLTAGDEYPPAACFGDSRRRLLLLKN